MRSPSLSLTLIGGPTVLIQVGELRFLTDPTFDPAGSMYEMGPVTAHKLTSPALSPDAVGHVDAVLLSHDEHADNLDTLGRALLPRAGRVLTTTSGARRLGGNAMGLDAWESVELQSGSTRVRVTGVPARHGPEGSEVFLGQVTGFVLEWEGQQDGALYVSGDTRFFPGIEELARRFRIGTAVLSVGDAHFDATGPMRLTLDATEALQVVRTVGAHTVVPVHLEGWAHYKEAPEALRAAFRDAGMEPQLLLPVLGEPMVLGSACAAAVG
ncbi:MAG TPA: MBL fold metallo-hydrolase [Aggregicoccus sp.]|nr:MBL fold metallo-hydrolase [Aggregicoccus sp.]